MVPPDVVLLCVPDVICEYRNGGGGGGGGCCVGRVSVGFRSANVVGNVLLLLLSLGRRIVVACRSSKGMVCWDDIDVFIFYTLD